MKTALVTGITGQDGAYLAHLLVSKGYKVYGGYRRASTLNLSGLDFLGVRNDVVLIELDLLDLGSIIRALEIAEPQEVYNLAAQSFVGASFDQPIVTADITGLGAARMLESIRIVNPAVRFYQASTSEMFGETQRTPQNESTPFYPRSPYAVAKLYAHWMTTNYREAHSIFACSGILFNHESPIRGLEFVTRKVTDGVARIKAGLDTNIALGDLKPKRDWGYAGDYVKAMWLMLQQDEASDYVIATGETHTVKEFVEAAFAVVGLDWQDHVTQDPRFLRPAEVNLLQGDATKARLSLGWQPEVSFEALVELMVRSDLERYGTRWP